MMEGEDYKRKPNNIKEREGGKRMKVWKKKHVNNPEKKRETRRLRNETERETNKWGRKKSIRKIGKGEEKREKI